MKVIEYFLLCKGAWEYSQKTEKLVVTHPVTSLNENAHNYNGNT